MHQQQPHIQPATVQQVPMQAVQIQTQQQPKTLSKHHKVFYILGVIEIVIAAVCLVSGIILVCLPYYYGFAAIYAYVASAIWCTVPLFVTGGLGICAKKSTSRCLIISNMVMAIITSLFMVILLGFSIPGAIVTSQPYYDYYYDYSSPYGSRRDYKIYQHTAAAVLHSINSLLSFAAFVIVIVHSAYCCRDTCCGAPKSNVRCGYNASTQQVIQLPNGQGMVIMQGQPQTAPTATVQYNYVQPGMAVTQIPAYSPQVMVGPSTVPQIGAQSLQNETKQPLPDNNFSGQPPKYQNVPDSQNLM